VLPDALTRPLRRIARVLAGLAALALAVGIGVSGADPREATAAPAVAPAVTADHPDATADRQAVAGPADTATPPAQHVAPARRAVTTTADTGDAARVAPRAVRPAAAHPERSAPRAPPADDDTAAR
jgi:hypothetical protein